MAHLLLNGVTTTGVSQSIFLAKVVQDHTVSCYYTDEDSSITALTIALEGSDDPRSVSDSDAHWYQLASHIFSALEIANKKAMFHVNNKPIKRIRLNLSTLTGAGSGDKVYARYIPCD